MFIEVFIGKRARKLKKASLSGQNEQVGILLKHIKKYQFDYLHKKSTETIIQLMCMPRLNVEQNVIKAVCFCAISCSAFVRPFIRVIRIIV